jgi:lycopene beta-cyclase
MQQEHYDYIITGSGCAGLSLALHMVQQKALQHKRILLIDETPKDQNDRTWCFWEKENGLFENIVCKKWETLWFYSGQFSKALTISPYRYKMIRGIDFYSFCFEKLKQYPSVTFLQANVETLFSAQKTGVVAAGKTFTADYVFNSILFEKPKLRKNDVWLLQHFKGWLIETEENVFRPEEATLMDFRISQKHGTAFCYVLPLTSTKALVEYTLFTSSLLPAEAYDAELNAYVTDVLNIRNYRIAETEFGVIPMTNHRFQQRQNNIINIGTAGGQTKGSSGYTFYFIQQHSKALAESLVQYGHPFVSAAPKRFHFYDSVLLQVLAQNLVPGKDVFTKLFERNKPQDVLAFLNNASSFSTELRIISKLPTLPFLKAATKNFI